MAAKPTVDLEAMRPMIIESEKDEVKSEATTPDEKAVEWLNTHLTKWRSNRDTNYKDKWEEYDRLWRGVWAASDKERQSERSKFISPAIAQAVESAVAELEEVSFGRGKAFVLENADESLTDESVVRMESQLDDDLRRVHARVAMSAAATNAAVYGTGILEIQKTSYIIRTPAVKPDAVDPTENVSYGTMDEDREMFLWHPVQPYNFLIDPEASSIEDALGVAIEERVSRHIVEMGMENGTYKEVDLDEAAPISSDDDKDKTLTTQEGGDSVKLTRYYGLMPREFLFPEDETENLVETEVEDEDYIEVCAVILNDRHILKLEETTYMMKERPVVAFQWDIVPNRFWGRGIVEKGYNSQKAHDAILRARFDSLALTVHPMIGVDSSRMPRGFKLVVSPGRTIPTNGRPSEIFEPFKIGQVDQNLYQEAPILEKMVFQATGAADMSGVGAAVSGEAKAGAVSMALSAVIKRFKRTLMNFHEQLFTPALRKTLHMYMQYSPELYPPSAVEVRPASSMGVIAREYEQQQLISLLQTMQPDSPAYAAILTGIVDNSNLPNRAAINQMILQGASPNPEVLQMQQEQAQEAHQLAMRKQLAEIALIESQAGLNLARTEYEIRYKPQIEMVNAMAEARPDKEGDRQFDKLTKVADLAIKEKAVDAKNRDIASNERIATMQTRAALMRGRTNG